MIFVQSVTAWAEVRGTASFNIRLTEVEVERTASRSAGVATLKGIVDKKENIPTDLGAYVDVYTAVEDSRDPWNENLSSQEQIFNGQIVKVTQNEEGLIVVEAVDVFRELINERVKLETEQPQYSFNVLLTLLAESKPFIATTGTLGSATRQKPFVDSSLSQTSRPDINTGGGSLPDPSEGLSTVQSVNNVLGQQRYGNYRHPWRFGLSDRGLPLVDALQDLVDSLAAVMWVDKENTLRIEPYPQNRSEWDIPLITEVDAGEDSKNANRILFEASGLESGGVGKAFVHPQTSHTAESDIQQPNQDSPSAPELSLKDDNVSTEEEADIRSYQEGIRSEQNRDLGTVTIVGNPEIELYDHVVVPEIEYDFSARQAPVKNTVQSGIYKVKGLTHKISGSDGFLTTIKLSPPVSESYQDVDPGNAGFAQQHLAEASNATTESKTSGAGGEAVGDILGR